MQYFVALVFIIPFISFNALCKDLVTSFENNSDGELTAWSYTSSTTGALDTEVLYEGQSSFRLMRTPDEDGPIFILQRIPLNFDAKQVELRARLKAKGTGPWAGVNVMLRQDVAGNDIQFDNTPFVTGRDTDWHAVKLIQAINPQAESLVFGAVLIGPGTGWVSDVQLWVDGERLTQLPENHEGEAHEATFLRMEDIESPSLNWTDLNERQIEDLRLLIQVWGFLKYMHPGVTEKDLSWDVSFVQSVHSLLQGSELTDVLATMLDEAGQFEHASQEPSNPLSESLVKLNSAWYQDNPALNTELTAIMKRLSEKRGDMKEGKYAFADQIGLPKFARERQYRIERLEVELNLLSLARLWNIIEYWFPYRQDLEVDWYSILHEYIPKVIQASSQSELHRELQVVLAQLNDGHAGVAGFFHQPPFGNCRLPVGVRYLNEGVVVTHLYTTEANETLQLGDLILAIDGSSMSDLIEEWLPFYSASNLVARYNNISNVLTSLPCDKAATRVTFSRDGSEQELEISDYVVSQTLSNSLPGEAIQLLDEDITYIKISNLRLEEVDKAVEQAAVTGKLIIDARGYPQDFILYHLGSRLIHTPTLFAHVAFVHPMAPGAVTISEDKLELRPYQPVHLDALAILVDETTFSQSEFSVMAWREVPNAFVVGSTTAGAVGDMRKVPLPTGASAFFTAGRILDRAKRDVQFSGIIPDYYIKPTSANIANNYDVVLYKAIELLDMQVNNMEESP